MTTKKVAVAILHGVGKQNPDFSAPMQKALTSCFASELKGMAQNPEEELVLQPVYWAPVLQERENRLWRKMKSDHDLDFLALRQVMIDLAADGIAYQPARKEQAIYDEVHAVFAHSLAALAQRAGADAPLCCIAHSLGTVIASNYFYDLQSSKYPDMLRHIIDNTPLEQGRTLTLFYTMGSPIAIWSLRYLKTDASEEFGKPIDVPSKDLSSIYPGLKGEWINFFDEDDVIGYPLQVLNDEYRARVKDMPINVGNWLTSWNPASHLGYWSDREVIRTIASGLVRTWKSVNAVS